MLRVNAKDVHLDMTGVRLAAGDITLRPFSRNSVVATIPIEAHVLGSRPSTSKSSLTAIPAVLRANPAHLRTFCKDVLRQLDEKT